MWFKVDDGLHSHRKARAVRRSHPDKPRDVSPFGLWVLAGSWSNDGFVPAEILEEWDTDALELARRLVAAGLWWETEQNGEQGYGFHDWSDYLPRPSGVEDASESGRRGNHIRWHVSRDKADEKCEFCTADRPDIGATSGGDVAPESDWHRKPVPTRPDPTNIRSDKSAAADESFEAFYALYPRKDARGTALRAWRAALKKADAQTITTGLRLQLPALTVRERHFIPLPASWLNAERWLDEVVDAAADEDPTWARASRQRGAS